MTEDGKTNKGGFSGLSDLVFDINEDFKATPPGYSTQPTQPLQHLPIQDTSGKREGRT